MSPRARQYSATQGSIMLSAAMLGCAAALSCTSPCRAKWLDVAKRCDGIGTTRTSQFAWLTASAALASLSGVHPARVNTTMPSQVSPGCKQARALSAQCLMPSKTSAPSAHVNFPCPGPPSSSRSTRKSSTEVPTFGPKSCRKLPTPTSSPKPKPVSATISSHITLRASSVSSCHRSFPGRAGSGSSHTASTSGSRQIAATMWA
mmetsp:Transcript_85128/g.237553  ORF Transcript_85128/g.237553 Transcript_85128/m.237553 type:complete len:204 (+) Transcript_85128:56-667(+)